MTGFDGGHGSGQIEGQRALWLGGAEDDVEGLVAAAVAAQYCGCCTGEVGEHAGRSR